MRLVSFLLRPRWKYRALSTAGVDKLGRQWSFAELLQLWVWPIVCVLVISLFLWERALEKEDLAYCRGNTKDI